MSKFGRTLRLLSYFMCANSEGSGETARMRRFAWALAGRLCDKYYNIMSWLNCCYFFYIDWSFGNIGSDIWKQNTAHIPGQGGIEGMLHFPVSLMNWLTQKNRSAILHSVCSCISNGPTSSDCLNFQAKTFLTSEMLAPTSSKIWKQHWQELVLSLSFNIYKMAAKIFTFVHSKFSLCCCNFGHQITVWTSYPLLWTT